MALSTTEKLRHTFHLASLRNEADQLRSGKHWEKRQEIKDRYAKKYSTISKSLSTNYKRNVESTYQKLLHRAAEKNKDFKHRWFGTDKFAEGPLKRQAHKMVRAANMNALHKIETAETKELKSLLRSAGRESKLGRKTKKDFSRAADRRQKPERRSSKPQQKQADNQSSKQSTKPAPPPRGRSR